MPLSDARALAASLRDDADHGDPVLKGYDAADVLDALADTLLTCATRLAAEFGRAGEGEALVDRLLGEAGEA